MHTPSIGLIREAHWLDGARARAYARIFAGVAAVALIGLLVVSSGGVDPRGEPLGTDFSNVWTASKLALSGQPASVYDMVAQYGLQKQMFGAQTGFYPFFYPPIYLLICWPLALLPYLTALAVWLLGTGYAYQAVVRRIGEGAIGLLPVLAFPAGFVTAGHGQNGLLTTALFGAAALSLERRPLLAGALFGCLAFKPHLAIVAPVALIALGRWRVLFVAGATALALMVLSWTAFGLDTWTAFFASTQAARAVLDNEMMSVDKLQSVFGAVRLLGGGAALAYACQMAASAGALLVLVIVLRKSVSVGAQGAAMATAAALTSPYFLDYDLSLLAIPLAWTTAQALRAGFLPWEKAVLALAFVLPAFSRVLAGATHIPAAPLTVALLFWCVSRRATAQVDPSCVPLGASARAAA